MMDELLMDEKKNLAWLFMHLKTGFTLTYFRDTQQTAFQIFTVTKLAQKLLNC